MSALVRQKNPTCVGSSHGFSLFSRAGSGRHGILIVRLSHSPDQPSWIDSSVFLLEMSQELHQYLKILRGEVRMLCNKQLNTWL